MKNEYDHGRFEKMGILKMRALTLKELTKKQLELMDERHNKLHRKSLFIKQNTPKDLKPSLPNRIMKKIKR